MFEVHPNNGEGWNLYRTGDGGFDLIATFSDLGDAEFTRAAFQRFRERPDELRSVHLDRTGCPAA